MPQMIAHFLKLIEYHDIFTGRLKFPCLVEYFLDVALATGGCNDLACNLAEPLKTFFAHFSGKYCDACA